MSCANGRKKKKYLWMDLATVDDHPLLLLFTVDCSAFHISMAFDYFDDGDDTNWFLMEQATQQALYEEDFLFT